MLRQLTFRISKGVRFLLLGVGVLAAPVLGAGENKFVQTLAYEPSSSSIPAITGMSFPRRVVEIAGMATWYLYFADQDRDVNWVRFEEFNGGGWMDAGQISPPDAQQKVGKIMVVTQCARVSISLARVWLYDKAENKSEPYYYVLDGLEAKESQLQIFDLAGGFIFTGSWITSVRSRWDLLDNQGRPVPNGVYLFVVAARGFDEHVRQIGPGKLVILR